MARKFFFCLVAVVCIAPLSGCGDGGNSVADVSAEAAAEEKAANTGDAAAKQAAEMAEGGYGN